MHACNSYVTAPTPTTHSTTTGPPLVGGRDRYFDYYPDDVLLLGGSD